MKFSIIIPAHNSAGFIRKALDSIKAQAFTDYELIVVCDSCTDDTEEVAREYGAVVESVSFHCDGLTRNRGMELAHGDWLLFMDDDDWWLHEFVLLQLDDMINRTPEMDILCFSFIWKEMGYASPISRGGAHWIACWCKCYRRESIGDSRFSNLIDGSADVLFYTQMFYKGLRIVDWDMPLYYYNYLRPGSISETRGYDYRPG